MTAARNGHTEHRGEASEKAIGGDQQHFNEVLLRGRGGGTDAIGDGSTTRRTYCLEQIMLSVHNGAFLGKRGRAKPTSHAGQQPRSKDGR